MSASSKSEAAICVAAGSAAATAIVESVFTVTQTPRQDALPVQREDELLRLLERRKQGREPPRRHRQGRDGPQDADRGRLHNEG
ncbi:hypothetical protein PMKS-000446 [Pichia membranifaciens]|uniref:Uncharacterized protein n=1 Tax=Pichia membranifaciens TaxID=4926 RepID=A0A1Q2YBS4_9ASCO|nr:hypothetical protein PMKS-000446 [Pichia membranifaciens]